MSDAKENTRLSSQEGRPSTSAGETSRPSEERSRRVGRMSVSTSNGSDLPPADIGKTDAGRMTSLSIPKLQTGAAPQITATPPTPTDGTAAFPPKSPVGAVVNGSQTGKRSRTNSISNTPSKLSQSMTSPVTPPGSGDAGSQQNSMPTQVGQDGKTSSFFQSMFSVAQNAATGLTNAIPMTLANNQANRPKIGLPDTSDNMQGDLTAHPSAVETNEKSSPEREPAVKTLGQGELNLASLGIVPEVEPPMRTDTSNFGSPDSRTSREQGHMQGSNAVPMSAISGHSGFETAGESPITPGLAVQDGQRPSRTPLAEDTSFLGSRGGSTAGDVTPDRNSIVAPDDKDDWDGDRKRSGSVRSGGGTSQKKRHRGSSAASGASALQPIPKPTGFAVASKKRNRDFHNLFKSVPEDDYLIEDYGCALQKEILLQGRFYVSEGHICFYSNILGWITTLVISFDEVMSVEKKSTALLFPNAIVIQTLHAKHVFASFISRDSTYDLIIGLWNVGHPQLVQGPGETHLDGSQGADLEDESGEDEDEEYEDESDEDLGESFTDAGVDGALDDIGNTTTVGSKGPSRKPSQLPIGSGSGGEGKDTGSANATGDFPGPATHAPTACGDDAQHYDKLLSDEMLPAPLGKVYSLMFGPDSYPFIKRLLTDEEKKTRGYTYIKPLNASIGPKQTKCIITEVIDVCDLEDHVTVTVSTQTPDVPSGSVFSVKTKYCLMWGENNTTRMICNCTVEWTGKSWIKGPIEKGASDGQVAYNKSLLSSLRTELAPKRAVRPGAKGKGKRKKDFDTRGEAASRSAGGAVKAAEAAQKDDSWGILEIFKPFFGPVVDIVKPLLPENFTTILLFVLVAWLVIGRLRTDTSTEVARDNRGRWEDAWHVEEDGLWEWLEDRTGIEGITLQQREGQDKIFEKAYKARTAGKPVKDRQVKDAIAVMEQRLDALKRIVEKSDPSKSTQDAIESDHEGEL
ncbi:hypothetical protein EDC01DRAFT_614017 [Geopyxis carbonaria]|nr:hypothetical protein EDC01DRAFT_614017 [Geopyxis carbonaria]